MTPPLANPAITSSRSDTSRRSEPGAPMAGAPPPAIQALTLWRVQPGALMLLARVPAALPAAGAVSLPRRPAARGMFRSVSWPVEHGQLTLMAIRLPGQADPDAAATLTLHAEGVGPLPVTLPAESATDAGFGQQAARFAGSNAPAAVRFMLDTLRPPADREVANVAMMLRAFLSQAAQQDGCVEIMTAVPDGCVLLQGWGAGIGGPVQVVLAGRTLGCFAGHAGGFARPDIAAPAVGVMLALPAEAAAALPGVDHVFVLSEQGLHSRALVEHRLLDPANSIGHIRHMLPSLRASAPMLAMLRDAVRLRYEGRDTLSGDPHPVRAAVDVATAAPGVGAYLSGWVFDPKRIIAALHLCGAGGYAARLDTTWTRVLRHDVSDAFRDQPRFPPPPDAEAGFAVFAPISAGLPAPAAGEPLHLQFTFTDGERAFTPILASDPTDRTVRDALLASVDLYKPSGLAIIERHVAPFMARVRPAPVAQPEVVLRGPLAREHAVVVPLAAPVLPRAMLSSFLHDPLEPAEHLVLVCGPDWTPALLDSLRALVGFYGLAATILATGSATAATTLREAGRFVTADTLLLAAPGVSGRAPGWRRSLRRAAREPGVAFACPTLLYEDWSIRFAGSVVPRFTDGPPYAAMMSPTAGLPAALAGDASKDDARVAGVPAAIGTLECCLVLRPALAALDGEGALATDSGEEAAFFLRLQAAGLAGLWASSVQVYAPETAEAQHAKAARLTDGWVLREAWREPLRQRPGA